MSATPYLYRAVGETLLPPTETSRAIGRCSSHTWSFIMRDGAQRRDDRANGVRRGERITLILSWSFADGSCIHP